MRQQPKKCEMKGCKENSVVGLAGVWMCMTHFDERLAGIGKAMRKHFPALAERDQPDGKSE